MFEEGFQTTHTATRFPAGRNGIITYNGQAILSIIYFLFIYLFVLFFSFLSFFSGGRGGKGIATPTNSRQNEVLWTD